MRQTTPLPMPQQLDPLWVDMNVMWGWDLAQPTDFLDMERRDPPWHWTPWDGRASLRKGGGLYTGSPWHAPEPVNMELVGATVGRRRKDGAKLGEDAPAEAPAESPELQRIQLLPIGEVDLRYAPRTRLDLLSGELRRLRTAGQVLTEGDVVREGDVQFVVIKCDPERGRLGAATAYYVDGAPVVELEIIYFLALGEREVPMDELFSEYLASHFGTEYGPVDTLCERTRLLYLDQAFRIRDVVFQVEATRPIVNRLGVMTCRTQIYAGWDRTPDFEKVQIVPFQDTLPQTYSFDIFEDYLKPFLLSCSWRKFRTQDFFTYHGVHFRIVAVEPDVRGRIGCNTSIYCEGTVQPSMRNLLSRDIIARLGTLPAGLQLLLLASDREAAEEPPAAPAPRRRGLGSEALQQIPSLTWPPAHAEDSPQQKCMVCLADFCAGDSCRMLPCRHVYHDTCIDEWLSRVTHCPICKDNVDSGMLDRAMGNV